MMFVIKTFPKLDSYSEAQAIKKLANHCHYTCPESERFDEINKKDPGLNIHSYDMDWLSRFYPNILFSITYMATDVILYYKEGFGEMYNTISAEKPDWSRLRFDPNPYVLDGLYDQ